MGRFNPYRSEPKTKPHFPSQASYSQAVNTGRYSIHWHQFIEVAQIVKCASQPRFNTHPYGSSCPPSWIALCRYSVPGYPIPSDGLSNIARPNGVSYSMRYLEWKRLVWWSIFTSSHNMYLHWASQPDQLAVSFPPLPPPTHPTRALIISPNIAHGPYGLPLTIRGRTLRLGYCRDALGVRQGVDYRCSFTTICSIVYFTPSVFSKWCIFNYITLFHSA